MNKQYGILCTFTSVLAVTLLLSGYSLAATPTPVSTTAPKKPPMATAAKPTKAATKPTTAPTAVSKAAGGSKADCLMCHGPFEKIITATADYKMPSGDREIKSNPHRYVPHDSKDIPECSYCHEPHPVPPTSAKGLPKPKATWCYGCHHNKILRCGGCH
jgi:predicted CXXCH cytochrome family protein